MMATALSLLVLTVIGMLASAVVVWRRKGPMKRVVLLLVLAAVAALNIAIWTVPDSSGESPLGREPVH